MSISRTSTAKPPGEGVIDFVGVMQALKDIDFKGYVTMEIGFAARMSSPTATPAAPSPISRASKPG